MRRTTKARHTLGIRGQLMWFLCFICLFLLGLFWLIRMIGQNINQGKYEGKVRIYCHSGLILTYRMTL